MNDTVKTETQQDLDNFDGNPDNYDCDSNVADSFIESIARSQEKHYGKRQSNKEHTEKRTGVHLRSLKKRKRLTNNSVTEDNRTSDEESREKSDSRTLRHPCPICTKEFLALELREHAHTHKALKRYLRIPLTAKVTPTTRFYTKHNSSEVNMGIV